MSRRIIRARVRGRILEVLDGLPLPEGNELELTVDVPEPEAARVTPKVAFAVFNLGARVPLTRDDIYDDAE
jgi:hypothetical protein